LFDNRALFAHLQAAMLIHPPNPLHDTMGRPRAFDRESHDRFQALLERHGDRAQLDAKREVMEAVRCGHRRPGTSGQWTRYQRLAARVALRQPAALEPRGDSPALQAWQQFLDRAEAVTSHATVSARSRGD
jgi:hypothetical protein